MRKAEAPGDSSPATPPPPITSVSGVGLCLVRNVLHLCNYCSATVFIERSVQIIDFYHFVKATVDIAYESGELLTILVIILCLLVFSFSRVALPCSVQEYQVGQLYSVAEASKNETGGGEGIQVLKNEPYEKDGEKGQYTHKIYHLKSKVPGFVRMIAPEGSLVFHEKAWNAYPYCRTIVTNEYMKDDFFIKIETWHKPDLGTLENVHNLDPNTWKSVEVVHIDIADRSQVEPGDYKADEDPALFQSVKTKRGPLGPNWKKELAADEDCPKMCAYKLVTIKFKWWGLQNKVENFIQKQEKRIFTNFHRQLFCWIDKWIDLTMEDIRRMEDETQRELEAMRKKGSVRGTLAADV
ncbi:PREDICTED: phosphatidylinositol transfer protein beta isoform [Gavialis gangeticus]|uniref:phosphatidylinositol transfer protein beta isoform n=1 Tax=Gavialis gangeticus TaxID=94835 RepID=UPI00092EE74D|nr:PREDICTED: phosphatidylinositol transfer protein beta isoform [Gavialis gangeticus]